jgi:hypothetical protein
MCISRQSAAYADRILKSANPADLPIFLPTKFEPVRSMLGIDVPLALMVRADRFGRFRRRLERSARAGNGRLRRGCSR